MTLPLNLLYIYIYMPREITLPYSRMFVLSGPIHAYLRGSEDLCHKLLLVHECGSQTEKEAGEKTRL